MILPLGSRYSISSEGYLMNIRLGKMLYGSEQRTGQRIVSYYDDDKGKRKAILMNRLMALTFLPRPTIDVAQLEVDHIDKNQANNRADNLRWCSHSDNMKNRRQFKRKRYREASTQT